jgi:RHS repeat-associated protein
VKVGTYIRDSTTALDYADQRYYASDYGRFSSEDQYQASAGPSDPGSWNRYAYVEGDPINASNPRGQMMCQTCVSGGVHGSVIYRLKGIAIFAGFCLGFGTLAESVSLRTGFPFGHYYFTDVMGPKAFQLPVLLALASLGIGYVAWILALLILGHADKPINGTRVVLLPLLASLIMVAWDLSMDPAWSMLDRAWIWQEGGRYFGVPVSNFFGWLAYFYYQAFALYCRANPIYSGENPMVAAPPRQRFWLPAILFYAVCGLGNVLILKQPVPSRVVTDGAGKQWLTADILGNCVLVSLLVMAPLALLAWLRVRERLSTCHLIAIR